MSWSRRCENQFITLEDNDVEELRFDFKWLTSNEPGNIAPINLVDPSHSVDVIQSSSVY